MLNTKAILLSFAEISRQAHSPKLAKDHIAKEGLP